MMKKNKPIYIEMARAPISDSKDVIISTRSTGGYSVAQEVTNTDDSTGEKFKVLMRGSMIIKDIEGLYSLRDALNVAIKKIEATENEDEWEEI